MNYGVTLREAKQRLGENGLKYGVLPVGGGLCMLAVERGARLLGPFEGEEGQSILWMNGAWKNAREFARFIEDGEYDLGGERLWIAPEFAFFTREKERFDETYVVQKEMDPGCYRMTECTEQGAAFAMSTECAAFEMPFAAKSFSVEKEARKAENPLRYLDRFEELMHGVGYCGYRQSVTLADCSAEKEMYLEPWFLTQVNPGGEIVIPYFGEFEFVDYYEPITAEYQTVENGYVRLRITGERKYKTAYKSAATFGRAAYVSRLGGGRYCALVRNYFNDPSEPYCSEPYRELGKRGCSLYVYNDSGENGGFAEFENSCPPVGLDSGRQESSSHITEWYYMGARDAVVRIVNLLLGIDYQGNV